MSEHGVHVHGPHDHAVEHEAHKGGLGQQVAIFTAVLVIYFAISYPVPDGDVIKATYMLTAVPCWAACHQALAYSRRN